MTTIRFSSEVEDAMPIEVGKGCRLVENWILQRKGVKVKILPPETQHQHWLFRRMVIWILQNT